MGAGFPGTPIWLLFIRETLSVPRLRSDAKAGTEITGSVLFFEEADL